MCTCVYVGAHDTACVWKSENNFVLWVLSFNLHMGSRKQTQVARVVSTALTYWTICQQPALNSTFKTEIWWKQNKILLVVCVWGQLIRFYDCGKATFRKTAIEINCPGRGRQEDYKFKVSFSYTVCRTLFQKKIKDNNEISWPSEKSYFFDTISWDSVGGQC